MCLITSFLNAAYVTLMVAGFGLSIASFVTPQWSTIELKDKHGVINGELTKGLLFGCDYKNLTTTSGIKHCLDSWHLDAAGWVTVVAFFLTFALCILGLAWAVVNCLACCCRNCLTPPLAIFAGLAFLSVTVAVGAFGISNQSAVGAIPMSGQELASKFNQNTSLGLSFWLGVTAAVALLAATIDAILLNKCVKVPLA